MRGKTYDQAMQMASDRWANASPAIRDKYAARSSISSLAPSERGAFEADQASAYAGPPVTRPPSNVVNQPVPPQRTAPVARRVASMPWDGDANGIPNSIQRPSPTAKAQSDTVYAGIADQRKAAGYPAETRTAATPRVNRLTGLPMGWQPGDALPSDADESMKARAAESLKRQTDATTAAASYAGPEVAPPKATIAPAPVRYADEQESYQRDGLDPKRKANMDDIYGKANSLEKAQIVGNSLKRAASLR